MPYTVNPDTGELEFFESISSGGGITQIDGDTGDATPSAGIVNVIGGAGITTTGSGDTLTISLTGGGMGIDTIIPNSGINVVPDVSGNVTIQGSGSLTTVGTLNTLTPQLTGLTLNAIQVGAGTATLTQLGPTNNSVLTTSATGVPSLTPLALNGQLIIGSSSGAPAAATLTQGSGVTITNNPNSITISVSSEGFSWNDVTSATQTLAAENGYITDRAGGVTYTLPATGALGDAIKIVGKLGLTTIAQNANQQILIGSSSSTVGVGGSVAGINVGDCIELVCITAGANTVWRAANLVGNWTIT